MRVAQHLGRDRADVLVADDAVLVDDVGLGHAVDAVVDADAAVGVEQRERRTGCRTAPASPARRRACPCSSGRDRHHAACCAKLDQHRVLVAAGHAPRGPDVEQPDLAQQVLAAQRAVSGASSRGSLKAGAGLPISGEGTSRGLSFRPTARKPTSTTKTASGSRKRFMLFMLPPGASRPRGAGAARVARRAARGSAGRARPARRPAPSAGSRPRSSRRTACGTRARSRRRRRSGSPSDTYRSRVKPRSIAASVIGMLLHAVDALLRVQRGHRLRRRA